MRIPVRDVLATAFVATAAGSSVLWLTGTAFTELSARRMGFVVLWLGLGGWASAQPRLAEVYGTGGRQRAPLGYVVAVTVVGVAAGVAGVAALAWPGAPALTALTVATVALWALATARHLLRAGHDDEAPRTGGCAGPDVPTVSRGTSSR